MTTAEASENPMLATRAVLRGVPMGTQYQCEACHDSILFKASQRAGSLAVVCNVYIEKVWDHTENFHPGCYEEAGNPFGEVLSDPPINPDPNTTLYHQIRKNNPRKIKPGQKK